MAFGLRGSNQMATFVLMLGLTQSLVIFVVTCVLAEQSSDRRLSGPLRIPHQVWGAFRTFANPSGSLSQGRSGHRPISGAPCTLTVHSPMQRDLINAVGITIVVCLVTA